MKHIVKLATLGAENRDIFIWGNEHVVAEEVLKAAGIAVTSLRPSLFYSNFVLQDTESIKTDKKIYKALGDAKLNFIYPGDIAAAAVVALTAPGHEDKDYYLTGPDTLTMHQVAALISAELGDTVTYQPLDDDTLRQNAAKFLPSQEAVEAYSNLFWYFRSGYYNVQHEDLKRVTGSVGKPLKEWIHENIRAFK